MDTRAIIAAIGFVCLLVGLLLGVSMGVLVGSRETKETKVSVGSDEISDLIRRLKPFAKYPNERWYMNGLSIIFYGDESVAISLEFPNETKIKSSAADLKSAVRTLTVPSEDVKNALIGWEK